MRYIPQGYSIWNNGDKFYWEYTGAENAMLNARELGRSEGYEKKPLWELMGKTEKDWNAEHAEIKRIAMIGANKK